jgi:hypothetical protein
METLLVIHIPQSVVRDMANGLRGVRNLIRVNDDWSRRRAYELLERYAATLEHHEVRAIEAQQTGG